MNLAEYDISRPYRTILRSTTRLTDVKDAEVRHLALEMPDGEFDFQEGQSIGVLVPGPHEFGNPYHLRLYSIANARQGEVGFRDLIEICVRRCFYIDEISGERYPGKASNFLCDAKPGDVVMITGPYGAHFHMPADPQSNLLMVGVGTGIAPFRAFVRRIYEERGAWQGQVRLFYGARTGTELVYRNQRDRDLGLYYDEPSFRAFEAISPRPHFDEAPDLDRVMTEQRQEIWEMMLDPKTYVYVAGLPEAKKKFEKAMIAIAGSEAAWQKTRADLQNQNRYAELIY